MGLLDDLRHKPKAVRDQYAFFAAAAVACVIALVWLVSVPAQFNPEVVAPVVATESSSVWSSLKTTAAEGRQHFAGLWAAFQTVSPATTTPTTSTPTITDIITEVKDNPPPPALPPSAPPRAIQIVPERLPATTSTSSEVVL